MPANVSPRSGQVGDVSQADVFSELDICPKCSSPESEYCPMTGLPHAPNVHALHGGYVRVKRWVAIKQPLSEFDANPQRYVEKIAEVWDVPFHSLTLISRVPVHLILVSPTFQLHCAGQYKLVQHHVGSPQLYNNAPIWEQQLTEDDIAGGFLPKLLFKSEIDRRWVVADTLDDLLFHLSSENETSLPTFVRSWSSNEPAGWVPDEEIHVTAQEAAPKLKGKDLTYIEVEAVVPYDPSKEEEHLVKPPPAPKPVLLPGKPSGAVRTPHHVNQRVAVRDKGDARWLLGTVVDVKEDIPLVRPDGHLAKWRDKYVWDEIAPVTEPAPGEFSAREVKVNGEYLAPDESGVYFTSRVVWVSEDGLTCDVYLSDGRLWAGVLTAGLLDKESTRADFARWRGMSDDTWEMQDLSKHGDKIDFEYRIGDRVQVRDSEEEMWLTGRVTGYADDVVVADLGLDDHTVQKKDMYRPTVMPDIWSEEGKSYVWKQVRKFPEQDYIAPLVGRRVLIVAVSYSGTELGIRQHHNTKRDKDIAHAAHNLALTLTEIGYNADFRLVTDTYGSQTYPSRQNILKGLDWLIRDASEGDSLLFAFIGRAKTATEDVAGVDGGLYPADYHMEGVITDNEIFDILHTIPKGVKLTCIFDTAPPTAVVTLPQAVYGENEGLTFWSPSSVTHTTQLNCMLNVLSLTRDSVVEFSKGRTLCGVLTNSLCDLLAAHREPTVNELIFQLSADLSDIRLYPQYSSNAYEANAGIMMKQFYLGSYPVGRRHFPPLPLRSIEVRMCGEEDAHGSYILKQQGSNAQTPIPDEHGHHAFTNYTTTAPFWEKMGDAAFQIRHYSGCWFIIRDVYGELRYLYRSAKGHPYPPVESEAWVAVQAPFPVPTIELKYGGVAAQDPAAAAEASGVLLDYVTLGRTRYNPGEKVSTFTSSPTTYTLRMPDGVYIHWVNKSKVRLDPADTDVQVGDLVAVRDHPNEDWIIGKILRFSKGTQGKPGRPYVKPQTTTGIPWENEGGYLFRYVEKVELGVSFEGKDVTGRWFPIVLTMDNGDGTYQADVHDETGQVKQWSQIHPQNMRRPRHLEVGVSSLRKEVERWRGKSDEPTDDVITKPQHYDYGFDHTILEVGDSVRIRDSLIEPWLYGTVKDFDSNGLPLVSPNDWKRGPYVWRVLELADAPRKEEEDPEEVWEDIVERSLAFSAPMHTTFCARRKVRCVRFTPLKLRDPEQTEVAVGCLQLLLSHVYELPNPTFKLAKEYTAGKGLPDYKPSNAGMVSYSCWKCPMPASVVFQLTEPAVVYGYRLQTPANEIPELDPISWKIEVADGVDSDWMLWDIQDLGENAQGESLVWETPLPVTRLTWSEQFRPERHWFEGGKSFVTPCASDKCKALFALNGTYQLAEKKGDGIRGQPLFRKGDIHLHLSEYNTWLVSMSESDVLQNTGFGFVRAPDTSVLCYKGLDWEVYGVNDKKLVWVIDPLIQVEPFVDTEVI